MSGARPKDLAIVVLNWNGAEDTIACLDSIEADGPWWTIVVDNGSEPADVGLVSAYVESREWVELIRHPENLGFAGGCNAGMRSALARGAQYVMLLNNDAILETDAVDKLKSYLEANPKVGAASPLVVDGSGHSIWAAGGVPASREVVCRLGLSGLPRSAAPVAPFEVEALIGCALVVRRELVDDVGLLDEEYFAYVEDVDFSTRARAANWRLAVVPSAVVRHKISAASGGGYTPLRSYLLGRGTALYVRKRGSLKQRLGFAIAAPVGIVAAYVRETPRGNARAVTAKARGYFDGLLRRPPRL